MKYDASQISAAIPCGVGFLGAGLIWKRTETDEETGLVTQVVHGLKTAASVWLSAAVGIACGGGIYFAAFFGTCLVLLLLRFSSRTDDLNADLEDLSGYGIIPKENSKNIQKKLNMDNNDFEDFDTDDISSDLESMLDYGTIPKQDSESIQTKLNYDFSGS
uniref:MgtC/SapB/SrpB/YhiD N-terminal domain-containing protein n=1 Tax=Corethron hystrix TaxID=216773 RepID=A0A7S1FP01_9STRA|mmetsp:Transcript_17408/g.39313  ORF Transcript_17408/g.39313 Transcript_17408/m.39313 type:complete len:161 (+) Transcript_17408:46-528(+)